ncbi:MAG: alpha-galactosidase [Ruminococcaceae bacterium]|nr:alpha-galactosidase [Oscillospiraceae bacterium]
MRNSGSRDFKENVFIVTSFAGTDYDLQAVSEFAASDIPKKFDCTYELDAGWYNYEDYGSFWYETGDYSPAVRYADGGLKRISDACHEAGIKYCLWLEPERLIYGTPQSEELKNNVIYCIEGNYVSYDELKEKGLNGGTGLVNYGKKETVNYITDLIDSTISEYGLDIYRQDFNTVSKPYWQAYDRYESNVYSIPRVGVTQMKSCEGYMEAWKNISENNPGLVFDSCASGGRRNDLDTIRFSFAHTKSDYWGDVVSQQGQNFGALSWLPFTGTGFINLYSDYDIRSRLTLSIGIDAGPGKDIALFESALDEWKSLHKYMYNDYYQISDYSLDGNSEIAMQFNDHENKEGMMIGYLRVGGIYDLVAKGLDPDLNYKVWDADNEDYVRVMSGKELMTRGFTVARDVGNANAVVVWYEKTDDGITDFDRNAFLEGKNDYIPPSPLAPLFNNEAMLCEKSETVEVGDYDIHFISSDYNSSGGIYLIGKKLFDAFSLTGDITYDEWSVVDRARTFIKFENGDKYPMNLSSWDQVFSLRTYVKEIKGKYFLWLDNSYGFGDADGTWKFENRIIVCESNNGTVESTPFVFHVSQYDIYSGARDLQFVFYDGAGNSVYRLKESFYEKLVLSSEKLNENGYEWTLLDVGSSFFKIPYDPLWQAEENDSLFKTVKCKDLINENGVNFYVTNHNGEYYLMIKNTQALSFYGLSDRWRWVDPEEGRRFESVVYIEIDGYHRGGAETIQNIIELW